MTNCGSAYSYTGCCVREVPATLDTRSAFYTWDLYTGVRYMQSGVLMMCDVIAYLQNIVFVADSTELISGTAVPMLYAPNELPKLPDGNGDGGAGEGEGVRESKLWIVGVAAANHCYYCRVGACSRAVAEEVLWFARESFAVSSASTPS